MPRYRFEDTGVQAHELATNVAANMNATLGRVKAPSTLDITCAAEHLGSLAEYMLNWKSGWLLVETDPPDPTVRTVENIETVALAANSAAFPVAQGFQDVADLSKTISTRGGSKLVIELLAATASITVGGAVRVLINGGSFANAIVGTVNFPVLVGGSTGFRASVDIPVGARADHTVRVQAAGVGILASVSLAAVASCMTITEYRG